MGRWNGGREAGTTGVWRAGLIKAVQVLSKGGCALTPLEGLALQPRIQSSQEVCG